ncbi:MAG: ATP phosphoribosyltransferase [Clostridia bacterium]|nr:ATP phosphoribosyltransferase [Clostridia bacterium]MBR2878550.1 ATP phosphoribosyltransferase [Clostridia bacterium]
MNYITVALAKGRLADTAVSLFEKLGYNVSEMKEKSRKLIFVDEEKKFKFILVKASDVPVYVEYGAADIGIVGRDTILEEGRNLYETLNLGFGKCKMAVCGPAEMKDKLHTSNTLRVATKYPNIAREYFRKACGQTIEIIPLSGSVELAPIVGLSEVIVDIVESGKTLYENGLTVLEDVCPLSAWMVVNRVSMKMERDRIMDVVENLNKLINEVD